VGLAVHTAARVCSCGHGGQVLLSAQARQASLGSMPAGARLRSLGSHRLAGLGQPEALFQLHADGLATRFPPLRIGP